MKLLNSIELLAPAKNLECAIAAIDHGADAIYIGGPLFGARAAAGNSIEDIQKVVEYAHSFYCKVYVTINTIIYENEIQQAIELISELYKICVDAIIIQDLGLLECELPPIPLHASTQLHNATVEKVFFLEKVGFSQIVLARELSLNQIREIKSKTVTPLEFFVHGALCVCYSGQCYMSVNSTGRSANRGECSQMCRHEYIVKGLQNTDTAKGFFLSPKDLNLEQSIEDLILAGVSSFKIEGRLKDVSYVKNITALYRKKIDEVIAKYPQYSRSSHGTCEYSFTPNAYKTFNRGYTNYYSASQQNKIATLTTPKSLGEYIGKIVFSKQNKIGINSNTKLVNGDGLCFYNEFKELTGVLVNNVSDSDISINQNLSIPIGTDVWRNNSIEFNKELDASEKCRKVLISILLRETKQGYSITISDEYGFSVTSNNTCEKQVAQKPDVIHDRISETLRKTGDTIFVVDMISIECNPLFFIPISEIAETRRILCNELYVKRCESYTNEVSTITPNDTKYPLTEPIDFRLNISNSKSAEFFKRHGIVTHQKAFELEKTPNAPLMTTKYCIRYEMDECPKHNKQITKAKPITISDNSNTYTVEFDCARCVMNIYAKR